jgi:hypothetical protein
LMLQPSLHAVGGEATFAVFRHNALEAQILKIHAPSASAVNALAAGITDTAGVTTVGIFNEPSESPIVEYLHELTWTPTFIQYEMQHLI